MRRGIEVERTDCTRCHKPFEKVGRATNLRTGKPSALCGVCHTNMAKYRRDQASRDRGIDPTGNTTPWHNLWPVSAHFERRKV